MKPYRVYEKPCARCLYGSDPLPPCVEEFRQAADAIVDNVAEGRLGPLICHRAFARGQKIVCHLWWAKHGLPTNVAMEPLPEFDLRYDMADTTGPEGRVAILDEFALDTGSERLWVRPGDTKVRRSR